MKKVTALIGMLLLTACSGTLTGQVTAETPYTIGAVAPLSNQGTNLGEPWVRGAEHAVEEINQNGGINGRRVELEIKDGRFQGKASVTAARSILSRNNPDILTTLFYLPANAVNSVMQDSEVPYHYSAYTKDLLRSNPRAFKAHFDGKRGCEQLIRYAEKQDRFERLGLLMADAKYAKKCVEGIRNVVNATAYWYKPGTKDFRTLLTEAENDGVDAVAGIFIDPEAVNVFSQLTELGYDMDVICITASECIYPSVTEKVPQEQLEGTLSIEFLPMNLTEHSVVEDVLREGEENSFTKASWIALGYDEIQYLAQAMSRCEPGDHDCIFNSMQDLENYTSIVGTQGFENRSLQAEYSIYEYRDGWNEVG